MKKIFINISYVVIVVVLGVYMLLNCAPVSVSGELANRSIIYVTTNVGLSIIGFILLFPIFILTIVTLSVDNKKVSFARDVIALFASLFLVTSIVIAFFRDIDINYIYVPVIAMICAGALLICSIYFIIKAIKNDELKEEEQEQIQEDTKKEVGPTLTKADANPTLKKEDEE